MMDKLYKSNFHCLYCGGILWYPVPPHKTIDEPVTMTCKTKNCSMFGDFLTLHHPFDCNQPPGDSFSLSYIK